LVFLSTTVSIFESDDIIQLGSRNFDNVTAIFARDHPVPNMGADSIGLSFTKSELGEFPFFFHYEFHLSLSHEQGLILRLVVLQGEGLARIHMEDLSCIVFGMSEDELIAPRLLYSLDR